MSISTTEPGSGFRLTAASVLKGVTRFWFITAMVGQLAFIVFILGFYGVRTLTANFAGWNDKALITGHVEGDLMGNAMFAVHVLLAAAMTLLGLVQPVPQIRLKAPVIHRWSGRAFLMLAVILALTGFWMTWIRGSHISIESGIAVSLNGVLILVFAGLALRYALTRQIRLHEIWALRLFMVASGVWFFRVFIMAWMLIGGGAYGTSGDLQSVIDPVLEFGSYLIPLALLEVWRRARSSTSGGVKIGASAVLFFATVLMGAGIFGTITRMWMPYL